MIFQANAQKEAWKWYFERHNGLDFSGDTVKFLPGCQFGLSESSSSICDSSGNLLFYSNGITLYNKFNTIVKNGDDLGFPINTNETSSRQGTLLLKHPNNDSLIYLFCTDYQGKNGGLVYSVVNIHGNNDSGEVINKKVKLVSPVNEPIHAVNHQNGRDIWIICHGNNDNVFYLYLLTYRGLLDCSFVKFKGLYHTSAQVNLKFSSNGKLITQHISPWGHTETFSFDAESGVIGDSLYYNLSIAVPGFEYSANSHYLYLSQFDSGLAQIDLLTQKKIRIKNFDQGKVPQQIQLGPDGKIYGAIYQSRDLFVIDRPEMAGDSCKVLIKKNFLQNTSVTAMPNFNQSYFYTPSIDFKYEQNCISNEIQFWGKDTFKSTVHAWQIKKSGKPVEGSYTSKNISHTFSDTGKYEVRYIASNGNRQDTVIKTITIHPKINKQFLGNDTAYPKGTSFSKLLKTPAGMHCVLWRDSSSLSSFTADTAGVYYCKIVNQSFCEVTDTIVISECNNSLDTPDMYRSGDTLFAVQVFADSFVWYKNNQILTVTKVNFIRITDTGHYRVEAARYGYCNKSSIVNWVKKLGLKMISLSDLGIRLYPNPGKGEVFISSDRAFQLEVFDLTGKMIYKSENTESVLLNQGVYFFCFKVAGYSVSDKVIIY
jgi:PKD repeat protein